MKMLGLCPEGLSELRAGAEKGTLFVGSSFSQRGMFITA
jgi:hypothetical protein